MLRETVLMGVLFLVVVTATHAMTLAEGVSAYESGDADAARTVFESIRKDDKKNAEAIFYLAKLDLDEGNYKDAIPQFKKAIDLDKENSRYHQGLGEAYGAQISEVGMFKAMRLSGKIRKSFQRAVDLDPENVDARFGLIVFYTSAPGIAGGSVNKALDEAEEISKRDKTAGYSAYTQVYRADEQWDKALETAQSWKKEDPTPAEPTLALGITYTQMERYPDAMTAYTTWLRENGENSDDAHSVYYQIGRTASIAGDYLDEGESAFERYFDYQPEPDEPSHAWAHYRLGLIYQHRDDTEAAKREFDTALKLEPNHKQAEEALEDI